MEVFLKEVQAMSTADIMLILDDQTDLYSDEELAILKTELNSRPENAVELEFEEDERQRIELENKEAFLKEEKRKSLKIQKLRENGYDGYWEYKVVSLVDSDSGVDWLEMQETLNELGMDGWHLISAYCNELGVNSRSVGFGGFTSGTNSTVDQNILIFERFNRFKQ